MTRTVPEMAQVVVRRVLVEHIFLCVNHDGSIEEVIDKAWATILVQDHVPIYPARHPVVHILQMEDICIKNIYIYKLLKKSFAIQV